MSKRHQSIGIKQTLRYDWMQIAANLVLTGLDAKSIRQELHDALAQQKDEGSTAERSSGTRTFAVNNLMNIWVSPDADLLRFRDCALTLLQAHPSQSLAVHWAMISAAYPFWFIAARQTGRLLSLQDQVTQAQIINRLKEHYGDRQTVSRYARFVIRSFVDWGVLQDADSKGCYIGAAPILIPDADLAVLMLEAALHAAPEGKSSLGPLLSSPAFFPFRLPAITGDFVAQHTDGVTVARYGLDDELLSLDALSE